MTEHPPQDIAIAGAGLLGRLLAWQLLERGHRVSLFEAGGFDPSPAAAWTAAGMVAPLSEAVVSDVDAYHMGLYALERWPEWLGRLGAPGLFRRSGSLLLAHPQDLNELREFERQLRFVLPEQSGYRTLSGAGVRELEPDLSAHFQQGLFLEDEGHLDNRAVLRALLAAIREAGGECREHCPVDVAPGEIIIDHSRHRFDLVIDCRGLGARQREGHSLRGVRGEVMGVQTSEVRLSRPVRLMHPRYQLYIVPKPGNCFVIGATQIESEDLSPMSLQSSLELGSALYTLSPAFAEARIIDQSVNLRPAYMDNRPHVSLTDGLISANGLFRHGYLLAPAVVDHVLARLAGETSAPFAHALQPMEIPS